MTKNCQRPDGTEVKIDTLHINGAVLYDECFVGTQGNSQRVVIQAFQNGFGVFGTEENCSEFVLNLPGHDIGKGRFFSDMSPLESINRTVYEPFDDKDYPELLQTACKQNFAQFNDV